MASRRRIILLVGFPLYALGLVIGGTTLLYGLIVPPWSEDFDGPGPWLRELLQVLTDPDWWAIAGPAAVVIAASQAVFLLPVVRLRPPDGRRSRPLVLSLGLGVLIAGGLSVGLALGLAELVASVVTGRFSESPWGAGREMGDHLWVGALMFAILLASWFAWGFGLLVLSRELWADRVLGRLVRTLLAGTILELLLLVPIDLMVRRRTGCYCATGTFFALAAGGLGLIWLAGPAAVLGFTRAARRRLRRGYCRCCGHAKGPRPGPVCPECGTAWDPPGLRAATAGRGPAVEEKGD